jgi:hypothetical protein
MRHTPTQQDGITLLITLLVMGVLLAVSTSILNITLKQYQLSGFAYASEMAFQAAGAGMECALYSDFVTVDFNVGAGRGAMQCFYNPPVSDSGPDDGDGNVDSGEEQRFEFTFGTPSVCSIVSVYKFYDVSSSINVIVNGINLRTEGSPPTPSPCPAGSVCTVIQSRGYNVACNQINSGARVVEREYTQVY